MKRTTLFIGLCSSLLMVFGQLFKAEAQTTQAVEPLMRTVRQDFGVFNAYCPYYIADDGTVSTTRTAVGCVATSIAQLLSHTGYVLTLQDTLHGWRTDHYTIPDILPGTTIDTRLIRDVYEEGSYTSAEADAVALLSYYAGVAVRMNWGLHESGASVRRAEQPLRQAFGLPYVHYLERYDFRPEDWRAIILRELQAGRPLLYAGYNSHLGGHAWVIDGIDANGRVHCRWGYNGHYDGYFDLDHLAFFEPPTDTTGNSLPFGFFSNHHMLLLSADSVAEPLPKKRQRTGKEVVVTNFELLKAPIVGGLTPSRLTARNTSNEAISITYEIFTNLPTDTALFKQGDYAALTALTLEAGEEKSIDIPLRFDEAGERTLRISPDDSTIVHEQALNIVAVPKPTLEIDSVRIVQVADDEITIDVPLTATPTNTSHTGSYLFLELLESTAEAGKEGTRHLQYIYLEPGERSVAHFRFRGLRSDTTYTLLVRNEWPIVQTRTVQLHATTGIHAVSAMPSGDIKYYDLNGRAASVRPQSLRKGRVIVR